MKDGPQKYDFRNRDQNKKRIVVAGLITELRELITKKGTRMAFGKLEDLTGSAELVIFPDFFAKNEAMVKDERPLLVGGFLEAENGLAKIIVDSLLPLEDSFKRIQRLVFHMESFSDGEMEMLSDILFEFDGKTPIEFMMHLPDLEKTVKLESSTLKGVEISTQLFEQIHGSLGRTDFIEIG